MQIIKSDKVIYEFSNDLKEEYRVSQGEEFLVETNDCFYQQIQNTDQVIEDIDSRSLNPATGPIYVEGAKIGDILRVNIKKIDIDKKGCSLAIPKSGFLPDKVKNPKTKIIDIVDGYAVFSDDIKIPIRPMIGVIGVACQKDHGKIKTNTPYKHGGNMDTTDITEGSTLYLPVAADGSMLALGDFHAVMGDGEVCVTGLEIPGQATLELEVIESKKIEWPILETKDSIQVIASDENLEEASRLALESMIDLLEKNLDLSFEDAYILSSLAVDLKISQVVNPKKTVRAAIKKELIKSENIFEKF